GHGLRAFTLPYGDVLAAVIAFGDERAGCRHLHSIRNAKGHVIEGILPECGPGIIRIPVFASCTIGVVIAAAFVAHSILSTIGCRNREFVACTERLWQNDG